MSESYILIGIFIFLLYIVYYFSSKHQKQKTKNAALVAQKKINDNAKKSWKEMEKDVLVRRIAIREWVRKYYKVPKD